MAKKQSKANMCPLRISLRKQNGNREVIIFISHSDSFVSVPCSIKRNVIERKGDLNLSQEAIRFYIITIMKMKSTHFPRRVQIHACYSAVTVCPFTLKSVPS